jgi:hypothetical protein
LLTTCTDCASSLLAACHNSTLPTPNSEHSVLCDMPMDDSLSSHARFLAKHGVDGNDISLVRSCCCC